MFDKEGMEKIVSAAVLSALEDQAAPLLAEMIDRMLALETDLERGGKPDYHTKEKGTFLEFVARQQLQIIVNQSVHQWFKDRAEQIRDQVTAKLSENKLADAYVEALANQVESYGFRINLTLERSSD